MTSNIEQTANRIKLGRILAIIRGDFPLSKIVEIGDALLAAPVLAMEVTLNSPNALESIQILRKRAGENMLVGAGTVLTAAQVHEVHAAGGQLVVSPNFNADVVRAAVQLGMVCLPGVMTATEAFSALHAGATGLKLFPAEMATPAVVKALRALQPDSPAGLADALLRLGDAPDQHSLPREQRQRNLRGAFAAHPDCVAQLKGRRLLLVDDVSTTGATLRSAAFALRQAGATQVQALVIARTLPH